jgi:hypothetical protein
MLACIEENQNLQQKTLHHKTSRMEGNWHGVHCNTTLNDYTEHLKQLRCSLRLSEPTQYSSMLNIHSC